MEDIHLTDSVSKVTDGTRRVGRIIGWVLVFLCVGLPGAAFGDEGEHRFDLSDPRIQRELAKLPRTRISVTEDPMYQDNHQYEGIEFTAFIAWLAKESHLRPEEGTVSFIATDGYRSSRAITELPSRKGVLADKEVLQGEPQKFRDVVHNRSSFNPGPYLVMWEGAYHEKFNLPIPWSIASVIFKRSQETPEHLPPGGDPELLRGMKLWEVNCGRCHSINKVGGTLGPELNVPRNVTEYWSNDRLEQLLADPGDLRWGTKMPAFDWMSPADRSLIIRYMQRMIERKVCDSREACAQPGLAR